MKLSEAILAGCEISEPLTTTELIKIEYVGEISACALGAAGLGAGLDPVELQNRGDQYYMLSEIFPVLAEKYSYPESLSSRKIYFQKRPLMEVIWKLNDNEGWTRERIAEWLRSIDL